MDITLVLVHKKPELGTGKQRLAAQFGTELTFRIAQALLACALEDAIEWPDSVVLAPAEPYDADWMQELTNGFPRDFTIVPQIEGNLGQRLNALDQKLRSQGLKHLVYIGSDAPGLTTEDYDTAREALNHYNVALMPAIDGGVVLMANRVAWPDLSALPWSTEQLGAALVRKCQMDIHPVHILHKSYDIDEPQDFLRLVNRLTADDRPSRRTLHKLAVEIASTQKTGHNLSHA